MPTKYIIQIPKLQWFVIFNRLGDERHGMDTASVCAVIQFLPSLTLKGNRHINTRKVQQK